MKKFLIFLIIFASCNSDELEDNQLIKDKIDQREYSECWLKLETDSVGNIIDTIDITKKKFDDENNLIFKKRIYSYKNQEYFSDTYYWEDGTAFLSIGESESKDFKSYSEVQRTKSKELIRLITFSEFEGEIDTLIMNYQFDYSILGKKKKLTLKVDSEEENSIHVFEYNQDEKVKSEMTIIELDTFERNEYSYSNSNLIKIEKYKQSLDTSLTIQFFSQSEKLDSTLNFSFTSGEKKLDSRIVYNYDENSVYRGFEEADLKNNKKRKIILKKKTCD